ncbi:MAG TPA: outer membrane beta-barrel protein [Candidatus Aminicenantes bacterium]|nr:outer membrane beta-barrel protein [Candidatus Aminicenantes bacterium]HRY65732.1 outer membrane beta-barrel protein [Candidatus Aminicenantes bacterium]HRZ72646.1 outer membrane beta-barrel protein [Candidatus Aminicenantes bacterium]
MKKPALALLAALLLPAAAGAETWKGLELRRQVEQAAWRFGPFRIQPRLVIANAGVDSNVYYASAAPVKDYTVTAGPAATIYLPAPRKFVLSIYGSPQYVWYSKTERERTWNYYLRGAAQLSLKNVFFSLDGVYSDARERWNTEIDIRPRRTEKGYGGSMLVRTSWRTSVALAYRAVDYDYESVEADGGFNVRERLNRREQYFDVTAYYQAGTRKRFFLEGEYGVYEFDFAGTALLRDSRSGAAYAGLEFTPLGRRVRGSLRLGYKKFDVRNPDGRDFQGLVGDAKLSVRLARPLAVRGSYVRDVCFSLWYNNPYYVESRPGGGVSIYVFRFLRFDYDYSFGRNDYRLDQEVQPGVEGKRRDDFGIHSAGVYVRIVKTAALGFIASWWTRDSNISGEDDKRTFFGLNLTYDF